MTENSETIITTTTHNPPSIEDMPFSDLYDQEDGEKVCYLCGDPDYSSFITANQYGFPVAYMRSLKNGLLS